MRLSPVHTLVLLGLLAGCGGSSNKAQQHQEQVGGDRAGAENDAGEGQRSASQIPRADRLAFIAIGTASGAVRARAALVVEGRRERAGAPSTTARARQVLLRTHPREGELVRLKGQALAAARAADGLPAPSAARSLLMATDAINAGLRRYAQRHPAIGGVIPD